MDSLLTAAARALAMGDALGALKRVTLRADAPALALRGIAMAQLGEYPRARELLHQAVRAFGANETLARACGARWPTCWPGVVFEPSVMGARGAGWRRHSPRSTPSRQSCYSPTRCRFNRVPCTAPRPVPSKE